MKSKVQRGGENDSKGVLASGGCSFGEILGAQNLLGPSWVTDRCRCIEVEKLQLVVVPSPSSMCCGWNGS